MAQKFNDLGTLISQLRNDAQDDAASTVDRINDLLVTIAGLNKDIKGAAN